MWKLIQNYLFANTDVESRNREMKNPRLKAGSSVITEGSQEEAENEALEESRLRDSTQISKDGTLQYRKEILGNGRWTPDINRTAAHKAYL